MQLQNRRTVLIALVLVFIFIAVPFILFFLYLSGQDQSIYNDPLSGETIYTPKNRVPEKYDKTSDESIILGLSSLLKRGFSSDNVELIRSFLTTYSHYRNEGKEISIDVKSIIHKEVEGKTVYSFLIRPDRNKSKDSIVTVTLSNDLIESFIMRRDNQVIFNSNMTGY